MKRIIKWILIPTLLLGACTAWGNLNLVNQKKKRDPHTNKITLELRALNRLYTNYRRTLTEYDTSNDASTDTLLWSPQKTTEESRKLLLQLLQQRDSLRLLPSEELSRQGRVERWSFDIVSWKNQYSNLLKILDQFVSKDKELKPLLTSELEKALQKEFYPEALQIVRCLNLDEAKLKEYRPKFAHTPEGYLLDMWLLRYRLRHELWMLEVQLSEDHATELDKKWATMVLPFEKEGERLLTQLKGSAYESEAEQIYQEYLGDRLVRIRPEVVNTATGEVRIKVFGILSKPNKLQRSGGTTIGELPKGIVRKTFTDHLPKVGKYAYSLGGKKSFSNFPYELLKVYTYNLENHCKQIEVLDRATGAPVPNVRIDLKNSNSKIFATMVTDSEGRALLQSKSDHYWAVVKDPRLIDEWEISISELPRAQVVRELKITQFYTDRPIYRRGQEVKVGTVTAKYNKGDDRHVLPSKPLTIKLQAYRNFDLVTLETKKVTTNQHGVAELTFTLPEDQDLSNFRLTSKWGNKGIEVQDYKRSYLQVGIDSIPTGYLFGHPMKLFGHTIDLNGLPTPATVELLYGDGKRIKVTSGADGHFVVTTPPLIEEEYSYVKGEGLKIIASDALGNTARTSHYLEPDNTDMPLDAESLTNEDTSINKEQFTLSTTRQPYNHRLLGDISDRVISVYLVNEQDTIPLGNLPVNGEQQFSLPNLPSGGYRLQLRTVDGYGEEQRDETYQKYYFYSPSDTQLHDKYPIWAEFLPDGALLFGSNNDQLIILSLEKEGKTLYKEYIKVVAGTLYKRTLPQVGAERVMLQSLRNMETRVKRLDLPKKEVAKEKAKLEGFAFDESIRPGSEVEKRIKVIGKSGQPLANTPVFITIYDKAVDNAALSVGAFPWLTIESVQLLTYNLEGALYGARAPLRLTEVSEAAPMEMRKQEAYDEVVVTGAPEEPVLRTNFAETAYFSALLETDQQGEVLLKFKAPDTQTKYVAYLYAFNDSLTEEVLDNTTLEVYSPLSIELSTPRYLVWGDRLDGSALIRNTNDQSYSPTYVITSGAQLLAVGTIEVPAHETVSVPFSITAPQAEELKLQAKVTLGDLSDGLERVIPLISNLSTYTVALPISLYKESQVTLTPPKQELASSDLMLQLYFDPIQLLLSKLAISHRESLKSDLSLFGELHFYSVYSRLHSYLKSNPELAVRLQKDAKELGLIKEKPAHWSDRIADPQTLASFYQFITNEKALTKRLEKIEKSIQSHAVLGGGFRYSLQTLHASPWLTHYILEQLGGLEVTNSELQKSLQTSLPYLAKVLKREDSYYRDFVAFALVAHQYSYPLPDFGEPMKKQVEALRKGYQSASNSTMLRFAEYSQIYDQSEAYAEVRQFIKDRSGYTFNDDEKLALMLFLNQDKPEVSQEVVKFALQVKQNAIWYDQAIVRVAQLILDKVTPTTISDRAALTINGERYQLSPTERVTGTLAVRYPAKEDSLTLTWSGIQSDYIFGGLSYLVTQLSAKVTPTGEKLTIEKQVYVRKVDSEGKESFSIATNVQKGDKLIVRYLIEAKQDLSLLTIQDPRPATAEFGYDFEGYRFADRLWFNYSRRDTHDRFYIDYLPRGRHQIELEAVATQSGHFTYGPAQIQSYYAPEYTGNSSGGSLDVTK